MKTCMVYFRGAGILFVFFCRAALFRIAWLSLSPGGALKATAWAGYPFALLKS